MRHRSAWACVSLLLSAGLATAGCDAPPSPRPDAVGQAGDDLAIGTFERPETLVASASRRLADAIGAGDVGQEFGVSSERVPYADTYWPFLYGGTDFQWYPGARDPRSPLEKYMAATDPYATEMAKMWELFNHGPFVPDVQTWNGHCPGWAAAATTNAPILHAVSARSDGRGGVVACHGGDRGCVRFEIGDINALMAEVYLDGPSSIIGANCHTPPDFIMRDRFGRILAPGCDGLNPGSLLVTLATLLKQHRVPFVLDLQKPNRTTEVWNQPVYRYHVYDYRPLTTSAAANLVAHGSTDGRAAGYPWNPQARGFAFVDIGIDFVGEHGPNLNVFPGTRSSYELRVAAVIELDADAGSPSATIVGGEYLDLPSSHATRLDVAPYVWVARGPGPENLPFSVGGNHHNPFVRPSVVAQLIALGQS
jgi:Transglutaminase elicitor